MDRSRQPYDSVAHGPFRAHYDSHSYPAPARESDDAISNLFLNSPVGGGGTRVFSDYVSVALVNGANNSSKEGTIH